MIEPQHSGYRWTSIGGHLALDLCNTMSWRLDPTRIKERLRTPDDLVDWFTTISGTGDRDELRRLAHARPKSAEQALVGVRALREATFRILAADLEQPQNKKQTDENPEQPEQMDETRTDETRTDETRTDETRTDETRTDDRQPEAVVDNRSGTELADVTLISTAWRDALALATTTSSLPWHWTIAPSEPERLPSVLALSVADLLHQPDRSGLRRCDGDGCGWLFLDTTRNHSRRWCDPLDCGNRARVRAYGRRQASARNG
jgi:predicted RNA-binding Zn ribbon-like protein